MNRISAASLSGIVTQDFSVVLRLVLESAEGAQYDSQGQALSGAKRVAPGWQ